MDRVRIANNYKKTSTLKSFIGVIFIYLPILIALPFVILAIFCVKIHLKNNGAKNIKPYKDFAPSWDSFRYHYKNQIIYKSNTSRFNPRQYKFFWFFNCNIYCPYSIASFKYLVYLISIVENWWCPFHHDKKEEYQQSAVDRSFWHIEEKERNTLHPEDRENTIWNENATK